MSRKSSHAHMYSMASQHLEFSAKVACTNFIFALGVFFFELQLQYGNYIPVDIDFDFIAHPWKWRSLGKWRGFLHCGCQTWRRSKGLYCRAPQNSSQTSSRRCLMRSGDDKKNYDIRSTRNLELSIKICTTIHVRKELDTKMYVSLFGNWKACYSI